MSVLEDYLRQDQTRLATNRRGEQKWVKITPDDRLKLINQLPHRWPEIIKARERGESIEGIHTRLRVKWDLEPNCHAECAAAHRHDNPTCHGECDPPCFRELVADCYSWIETELHALAQRRAEIMI